MSKNKLCPHCHGILEVPSGPWLREGDFKSFGYSGMRCTIQRMKEPGYLCGYVEFYDPRSTVNENTLVMHGGPTYDQTSDEGMRKIGFDCAHANDLIPYDRQDSKGAIYRTMDFVELELRNIVRQILDILNDQQQGL